MPSQSSSERLRPSRTRKDRFLAAMTSLRMHITKIMWDPRCDAGEDNGHEGKTKEL